MPVQIPSQLQGLQPNEVAEAHKKFGFNRIESTSNNSIFRLLIDILKEPMLVLLFTVSIIYLIIGDYGEALFMFMAIVGVSAISLYQDTRSKRALEALEKLNEPLSRVIRGGKLVEIPTHEIAVGDLCMIEEGKMINADGIIRHSNDFSVNESALTGESLSVYKSNESDDPQVFSGTLAVSGLAFFEVQKIGKQTKLGQIGMSLANIQSEASPLQVQIRKFVKTMAIVGIIIFLLVCLVNYYQSKDLVNSLLNGLTLAMSILPEEIPVAFTTFMALGAWKLMRDGIIVKKSSIVETLGSTTVICTDKTGTITENTMHLKHLYDYQSDELYDENHFDEEVLSELIQYAMWSSEPVAFDPMEITLHRVYEKTQKIDQRKSFEMFHEYPLGGKPPMMTHLFKSENGQRIIAAKGAPEAILNVSTLVESEKKKIRTLIQKLGQQGYRILGVAKSRFEGDDFPAEQQTFEFDFLGLVVFYDPPKKGIQEVFKQIYDAGIQVKVITGDNTDTTRSIATQSGISHAEAAIEGTEIMKLAPEQLLQVVEDNILFTRMFPDAKLAVVNALKERGEVVAMLGDGVNDGPALKSAHIGVAMGTKGTEIAKAAAALVITNDDLDKLIIGIASGRRIYANIKKAVQYIISIHIPIILTVSLPLFLGWNYPQIFTPVHVIFLELIMGPICSIVYENEPMERNTMAREPRKMTDTFLNWNELTISIIQGLLITAGILFIYQWSVREGADEEKTRAMVFTTLIFSNILLSFANRSFYYSLFESFRNRNYLFVIVTVATLVLLACIFYIEPIRNFFHVSPLNLSEIGLAICVAMLSVLWFEVHKLIRRSSTKTTV